MASTGASAPPTLKMPPFCQAIFSTVSPRICVWSIPSEETPHTHGRLQGVATATAGAGGSGVRGGLSAGASERSYLMMLVQS